jgi:hypothetical protein
VRKAGIREDAGFLFGRMEQGDNPPQAFERKEKRDCYCIELFTLEKTLLELDPTKRIVPTTITRMTANITAYSAMSCPASSFHSVRSVVIEAPPV